jgi:deoxyribodipyrimidine photo-lyase
MTSPSDPQFACGMMWFRRDLRLRDNKALFFALQKCKKLHAVFILDKDILSALPAYDRRVEFILKSLDALDQAIKAASAQAQSGLIVQFASSVEAVPRLAIELGVDGVFANHDDEPQSLDRDAKIRGALAQKGIHFETHKDHVIFERSEVMTLSGTSYGVFTPYKNAWLKKIQSKDITNHDASENHGRFSPRPIPLRTPIPTLEHMGFQETNLKALLFPTGEQGAQQLIQDFEPRLGLYKDTRDFPAIKGPSYLSTHLRFGTVSIRQLVSLSWQASQDGNLGASTWLSELIWRDFYHQILHHHPRVVKGAFKPEYDRIQWESGSKAKKLFQAWCMGETGYPLVDAAMKQINQTGYMHNRLRMVVASFLVKDLGIDWKWGEAYFATHLNDFDLAANNGGWQWASSSGCDAQPYFRIFNPITQSEKFDSDAKFIKKYLPEFKNWPSKAVHAPWLAVPRGETLAGIQLGKDYPMPIVDHAQARESTLKRYAVIKNPV